MRIHLNTFSCRFAEQVINSKLSIKQEIENILLDTHVNLSELFRPKFNSGLEELFIEKGWEKQPAVFDQATDPSAKMHFLKERIGIEIAFGHASFIVLGLMKFQVCSYSGCDKIDVGVYIVTMKQFQKTMG